MIDEIFEDWDATHTRGYGRELVRINHRLHQSPLFTDAAIERLIETYPREHYDLHTMVPGEHRRESWREGDIGTRTGKEVMEAIRHGQIWLNLRKVMKVSAPYGDLLNRMFAEIEDHVPGLHTYKHNFGMLISSPKAQVFFHADIPGQSLWQIRGVKRVYVYPNEAPFLPQEGLEAIVLNEADESDLPYHTWYDDESTVIDLQPGEMLHWPLNAPHRVVNLDTLNVSITTEHYTNDIRNTYVVNYANGILRRRFGFENLSRRTSGPAFLAKMALAAAYKYSGIQKQKRFARHIDFAIDPASPLGFRDISPRLRSEY
jgi:hypothetical protein